MKRLSLREKAILTGLYLSKFDQAGLRRLGFENFVEAFNVIGSALGVQPASIKNYRDEFDPLFPNKRKGWHRRPMRGYCRAIYDSFAGLTLDDFTRLLKRIVYKEADLGVLMEAAQKRGGQNDTFAKRLVTGQAAEQYFKSRYKEIPLFKDFEIEDTTRLGYGFDFKLNSGDLFYGIEVKGLSDSTGSIILTDKEYSMASMLKSRFFLFVVKNFKEKPFHELYQDPLNRRLLFKRIEQKTIQISWTTRV